MYVSSRIVLCTAALLGLPAAVNAAPILSIADSPADDYNLSTEGTTDWVQFGYNDPSDSGHNNSDTDGFTRKRSGPGTAVDIIQFTPSSGHFTGKEDQGGQGSWTGVGIDQDGNDVSAASGIDTAWATGNGAGDLVTLTIDDILSGTLTLRTYLNNAVGQVTARIVDQSSNNLSGDVVVTRPSVDVPSDDNSYTITFAPDPNVNGGANQSLVVELVQTEDNGGFDRFGLKAASLNMVPEPASLALLGLGSLALLPRRRRMA